MNLPAKWTSVEMILYDVLYISYLLPVERVRPFVPERLPIAAVDGEHTFVSAVFFHVLEAKAARLPSPRVSYNQVNVYTFVTAPKSGQHAIYFLRKGMTSKGAARAARWLRMPVELIELELTPRRDKRLRYEHYALRGTWHGNIHIEADEVAPRLEALPPFASGQEAVVFLTDPLVGFYGNAGWVWRLDAWHPRFQPRVARATRVEMPILAEMGLLKEDEIAQPHNVLLAPREHFLIHLPPRRA